MRWLASSTVLPAPITTSASELVDDLLRRVFPIRHFSNFFARDTKIHPGLVFGSQVTPATAIPFARGHRTSGR